MSVVGIIVTAVMTVRDGAAPAGLETASVMAKPETKIESIAGATEIEAVIENVRRGTETMMIENTGTGKGKGDASVKTTLSLTKGTSVRDPMSTRKMALNVHHAVHVQEIQTDGLFALDEVGEILVMNMMLLCVHPGEKKSKTNFIRVIPLVTTTDDARGPHGHHLLGMSIHSSSRD